MRYRLAWVLILLAVVPAWADSELWLTPTLQKSMFNIIPEIRIRGNLTDWYYLRVYLGPTLQINQYWAVNAFYAPNYVKNGSYWNSFYYLDGIYKLPLPWLVFSNRARAEYDASLQVLKYRNLFWLGRDGWFAADELFYNLNRGYFDEGRSSAGYAFKVRDGVELSLGYLWRRQKTDPNADWTRTGAFNIGTKIVL